MTLTLIAEVLSGETLITPGGCVDTETACGLDPFTWDGWLEQLREEQQPDAGSEALAAAAVPAEALAD